MTSIPLKRKNPRKENTRGGAAVGNAEEKGGESEGDISPVGCWEDRPPKCRGCSFPWITTSSVNRFTISEETAYLEPKAELYLINIVRKLFVINNFPFCL